MVLHGKFHRPRIEAKPKIQLTYKAQTSFEQRNNSLTYDGKYNMFTGGDDFVKTGQINLWNDDTKVPEKMFTEHCGMLNGSAGEFFPAHRDVDMDNGIDYVDLFSSDICR